MRLAGRVFKRGRFWTVEVPILDIATQGHSQKEAYEMIADAIESLVNKEGFRIEVFPGKGQYFEVGATDLATLTGFLLHRQRIKQGLTLMKAAKRLGVRSHNTYARHEKGESSPSLEKLRQLLSALSPDNDFVLILDSRPDKNNRKNG